MRRIGPTEDEAYDELRDEHPEDTPQPWVNPNAPQPLFPPPPGPRE